MELQRRPEANLTEGVKIDDYSTYRPCGLRIEMRSAERGSKSVGFHVTGTAVSCNSLRGGGVPWVFAQVYHSRIRLSTHSAVVSHFEKALPRPRAACRSGTIATPPKAGGACGPKKRCAVAHPFSALMTGSLSSSFIPAGRLGTDPFPSRFIVSGSVLAVKGLLRRSAPWTAPGRS